VSATRVIQEAIYSVLSNDATLAGLSLTEGTDEVSIYNDVPEGGKYPHVLITKASETPWHSLGGPSSGIGWKNIIRAHVRSRYQGDREALRILERIVALLNFQDLTVSGYPSAAIVEYEGHKVLVQDIDKIETRNIVGEFCVMVGN
jgi:hypothetical protein